MILFKYYQNIIRYVKVLFLTTNLLWSNIEYYNLPACTHLPHTQKILVHKGYQTHSLACIIKLATILKEHSKILEATAHPIPTMIRYQVL